MKIYQLRFAIYLSNYTSHLYNKSVKVERNFLLFYILKNNINGSIIFVYFEINLKTRIVELPRKIPVKGFHFIFLYHINIKLRYFVMCNIVSLLPVFQKQWQIIAIFTQKLNIVISCHCFRNTVKREIILRKKNLPPSISVVL